MTFYVQEELDEDVDDGTMPGNVEDLAQAVVGHKIVRAGNQKIWIDHYSNPEGIEVERFIITLDDGTEVILEDSGDCCAYTELQAFLLNPDKVEHVIMGVGTTDEYSTWHIYADAGDVLTLTVGWSPGNPFYYGYGFTIRVVPFGPEPDEI